MNYVGQVHNDVHRSWHEKSDATVRPTRLFDCVSKIEIHRNKGAEIWAPNAARLQPKIYSLYFAANYLIFSRMEDHMDNLILFTVINDKRFFGLKLLFVIL